MNRSFFIATLALAGCAAQAQPAVPPGEQAVPVRTAAVKRERRAQPVNAAGVLAGKQEVRLSFKVGGIVDRLLVDEGATVKQGQLLAVLKRPEIDAAVTMARQGLDKAERDRARVQELYDGKAATLEQLQNATTAVDVGRAALNSASFNNEHAAIVAPAAGKVLRRLAEPDELVTPGTPILLVRASGRGWVVRVGVSDRDVARLALGDRATVSFDALADRVATRVAEIAESATPGTGTYEVELALEHGLPALRSGMIGHARIEPVASHELTFVPVESLQEGDGLNASVFAAGADGRAQQRAIQVAFIDGAEAAVAAGLDGVESVVTAGADRLAPGARFQVVTEAVTR